MRPLRPKVLAMRPGSIGNSLAATPAIRAIKKTFPDCHLAVVCDAISSEIFHNSPHVDEIIPYDKKGRDRGMIGYIRFVMSLRRKGFESAIMFKRFTRMSLIAFFSGARERVGFEEASPLATRRIPYREDKSIFEQNLELAALLGAKPDGTKPDIWPTEEDRAWVFNFLDKLGVSEEEKFVVIHPSGVSQREKLWPVENFATLADGIEDETSTKVVFIEGPGEESIADMLDEAASIAGRKYLHTRGALSIRQTAFLISRSKLFVGSDSGPAHLAGAFETPEIIIYPPREDLENHLIKWRPVGEDVHILAPGKPCSLCPDFPCTEDGWIDCFRREVGVERAVAAVKAVLAKNDLE